MPTAAARSRLAALLAAALACFAAPDTHAQTLEVHAGASPAMRAAGMALRDGALAPGMLTVRVVRGSFDRNAAGEPVQIDVSGRIERAVTGTDGRAEFAHLPIGAAVQATAVVDGEALVSERFEIAAESGIRVLLIAGDGDATASGIPADQTPLAVSVPAVVSPVTPAAATSEDAMVVAIRVVFAVATGVALVLVVFGKYRWRPGRPRRSSGV